MKKIYLFLLIYFNIVARSFDAIKIELDGSGNILLNNLPENSQEDYFLKENANEDFIKEVFIKNRILYIRYKRKAKKSNLKINLLLSIFQDIETVEINAGNLNALIKVTTKLNIKAGRLKLNIPVSLKDLKVKSGMCDLNLNDFVYSAKINSGKVNVNLNIANLNKKACLQINAGVSSINIHGKNNYNENFLCLDIVSPIKKIESF